MESLNTMKKLYAAAGKYRYAILILLLGLLLMLLPNGTGKAETAAPVAETTVTQIPPDLEQRLEQLLSQIQGAGTVRVLLTERSGSETVYQSDEQTEQNDGAASKNSAVVITEDEDHTESALVRRVDPPVYQGAVIVCQGADDPRVKLAIVEAVRCATGLGADQISVIKMKS